MQRAPAVFHAASYLQYPLALAAAAYVAFSARAAPEARLDAFNTALVLMGLSVSFSTLQDTTTTQNELSRRVWTSPLWGRVFLAALTLATTAFIGIGLWGVLGSLPPKLEQLSFGLLALGIGMVGLLKVAGEMFQHHRRDHGGPPA